jgi:hypothetical protein
MDSQSYLLSARNDVSAVPPMSEIPVGKKEDRLAQKQNSAERKVAVVQCEGFRCLAYRDAGIWRDFQTGKELPEVKSIVFEFPV